MRHSKTWIAIAIVPALWAGSATAAPEATADRIWNLIEAGAAHIQASGPEKALRDFADRGGKWQQSGFHLSVIGPDGRILVDSEDPQRVGTDIRVVRDTTGRAYGEELSRLVKEWGTGGVEYSMFDPATGQTPLRTAIATQTPRFSGMLVVTTRADPNRLVAAQSGR